MSIIEPAAAVEQILDGLAQLEEVELWQLSSGELIRLTEALHRAGTSIDAHALRAVAEFESRGLAPDAGAPTTWAWLVGTLRMGPGAAKRQVRLAKAIVECPATLDAVAGGRVSVEQAEVITRTLTNLPPGLEEDVMVDAEQTMIEKAADHTPTRLAKIGHHLLAVLDPDGPEPSETEPPQSEPFLNYRTLADGTCEGEFRLDPATALTLTAMIDAGSAPKPSTAEGPDLRTAGRRRADALADLITLASRTEHPRPGAGRPTIAVTVTLQELAEGLPVLGPDLQTLDAGTVRRLACDAHLIPVVLGSRSEPLDIGRRSRTTSLSLRNALVTRDKGCAFPGCQAPPGWADAHHIVFWAHHGETKIDNLVLLCPHHHDAVHHRGWTITMTRGRPEFTPPPWLQAAA